MTTHSTYVLNQQNFSKNPLYVLLVLKIVRVALKVIQNVKHVLLGVSIFLKNF